MILIKTMKQLATARTIPSFRVSGSNAQLHFVRSDQSRRLSGYAQIQSHELRRQWLNRVWENRSLN
jgi:hypothetical protein